MHEVESWGGGVARYYSAMKEAGLPPPVAEERNGFFTVVFWRPKKNVVSGAINEGVNEGVSEGVNEGVCEGVNRLLNIVIANPGKRTNDLAFLMGKSVQTVERYVKRLKTAGKIEFRGAPKTGGYYKK